jgi:uncharacterized protein (DUF1499 family)
MMAHCFVFRARRQASIDNQPKPACFRPGSRYVLSKSAKQESSFAAMLNTIVWAFLALIAIAILAFVLIGRERSWEMIAGSPDRGHYDFAVGARSPSGNDALACSPGLCESADFDIAPFEDAPEIAIERLAQRLLASDPLAHRVDDGTDAAKARFVTYSPVMRFPDVIHLQAIRMSDGRTGVMAYARAQLGRKDFGKNRARLEALLNRS